MIKKHFIDLIECARKFAQGIFFATRIPGHVQPVGRPCGTWMHYAMRDAKDMGQQMGYRNLEWNWPKEAMNMPIGAGIVDGAKLLKPFSS